MTLPTTRPPRRISNRTKKRCRNIKNFFCRALNTKSETNNKNQSLLDISISDLKEKISGLETQLDKISRHCDSSTRINDSTDSRTQQTLTESKNTSDRASHRHSNSNETRVLYKATSSKYGKTDGSDNTARRKVKNKNIVMINSESEFNYDVQKSKRHKVRETWPQKDVEYHHYKKSAARHLANIHKQNICKDERKKQDSKKEYQQVKIEKKHKHKTEIPTHSQHSYNERCRGKGAVVDQDFISNIIKKQYKPIKVFGAEPSNMSQVSAPICRDKEYSVRDKICYDYDLCSCCFDQPKKHDYKKIINSNVGEMRSVCDARLYSSKKTGRYGHSKGLNDYNNADFYDVIPVREKSSPKARRRIEYKSIAHNKYNEVPPSPRTLRPRLNLQAKIYEEVKENNYSNECSSTNIPNKNQNPHERNVRSDNRMEKNNILRTEMSTLMFENIGSREENFNESKQSTDTDRNLAEIKDLLHSFLMVINKNSTHGENNTKLNNSDTSNNQANTNTNVHNNTMGHAFPYCNVPPVMPILPNNCCYPMMPIYPVNYLQNGYLFPNVSNTCNSNVETSKHPRRSSSTYDHKHGNSNSETHELLKEIHDFVTQAPKTIEKKHLRSKRRQNFVTRSVGDSSIASNYSKNVKETKRCISKSCEAIGLGCGDTRNLYSNTSFSDTVLERFSIEATRSTTDFNPTFQTREIKINKLKDIFNPWKWGKKKNDALEEISEGEDIMEEDIERSPPPFRQNITNYAMYRQEYYNPPPIRHQQQKIPKQSTPLTSPRFIHRNDSRKYSPSYPDYPNIPPHYYDHQTPPYQRCQPEGPIPQVPLCLKEIEVKSAGTQSERKMSLFKKFTKKVKVESVPSESKRPPVKAKSGIFNWKALKESAKSGAIPKDFTLKTQQHLNQGDTKMKNALIKKLFYKRNPFSPRNLIVKTLLGNDPSSYGNPPRLIKPKYFI